MIAEESTAWPGVSLPPEAGGLGFNFKWNMGWMNDTLAYMALDPVHRQWHHDRLTFGLLYAFSENFVLPISHDEVVHGKGSVIGRMSGDDWQKFASARAYFAFMWAHPGKKLLFMGQEFGQRREWAFRQSLDWHLVGQPEHAGIQRLVKDLNALYKDCPALHRNDFGPEGFEWIDHQDAGRSVLSFVRHGGAGVPPVLVVCNFAPVVHHGFRLGVPQAGLWRERLNTDSAFYGGSNVGTPLGEARSEGLHSHGRPDSICITLPPLATVFLEWTA